MKPISEKCGSRRRSWLLCLFGSWLVLALYAQGGVPFFVNYMADNYRAHNRNFDVVCDSLGITYVANFEGVLFYNGSQWGKIMTPNISRITRLYVDRQSRIWVGGYNYIGRIGVSEKGSLRLLSYVSDEETQRRIGEVSQIEERGDTLLFLTPQYRLKIAGDSLLSVVPLSHPLAQEGAQKRVSIRQRWEVSVAEEGGLLFTDLPTQRTFRMTEANGLCSNMINALSVDVNGSVWGATDQGVFRLSFPSFYSHYTTSEGLEGEVTSVARYLGRLYVGTMHGLFMLDEKQMRFHPLPGITQACWQLREGDDKLLYAATTNGLFRLHKQGRLESLTDNPTFSVAFDPKERQTLYAGELDGIYRLRGNNRTKVSSVEKAMKLLFLQEKLWVETLYGEIYQINESMGETSLLDTLQGVPTAGGNRLHQLRGVGVLCTTEGFLRWDERSNRFESMVSPMDSLIQQGVWWPGLSAKEPGEENYWLANGEGKELRVLYGGQLNAAKTSQLRPIKNYMIRTMLLEPGGVAWLGGDFGLICFDPNEIDMSYQSLPSVSIYRVQLNKDSLYWEGMNRTPIQTEHKVATFSSDVRELTFSFASETNDVLIPTEYSYYLEGYEDDWRPWTTESAKEYTNLWYGSYTFHVKARDMFGRESAEDVFSFTILAPFYLKWYALLGYLLLLVLLVMGVMQYRTRKLLKEKMRLESIIAERTQEVVMQRDEIAEKSSELEGALRDLKEAQDRLIRQEKVAMVGKLTQGLIDRILNPLNYIINFSHLSGSLLKDMCEDVEDEQEQMSKDNYEDMQEIMEMLATHLSKIEEHGQSTSRILKAMEELLSEQACHFQSVDINQFMADNIAELKHYDAKLIAEHQIAIHFQPISPALRVDLDCGKMGKAIVSMLHNSVYAIAKKRAQVAFEPTLDIRMEREAELLRIYLQDNGIGIEPNILEKIFDPFFTTKTTAEAAGVGLYLSKEMVLSHNGQIEVRSEKNVFTEFVMTVPIHQNLKNKES